MSSLLTPDDAEGPLRWGGGNLVSERARGLELYGCQRVRRDAYIAAVLEGGGGGGGGGGGASPGMGWVWVDSI